MSATLGKYNISSYVNDLIPEHVASTYPDLVEFIKVYALYLERSNNSGFYLNSLDIQRDIDHVEESLLTELQNEIGIAVPRDFATDPRNFYKHLIEFYRSRGTPESITSFFRMIYDDEVETYFPYTDLLNPSDGDWTDQSADIIANQGNYTPWNIITIAPVAAGSFVVGLKYKITVLTGTSQARWNLAAGTSGVTYVVGDTFTAATTGLGTGTATSNLVAGLSDELVDVFFDDDIVFVNDVYQTPGTDYVETVYSDTTTKYKLNFTIALTDDDVVKTYPAGLFTTANGFLSDKKYIQDSHYWQKFSYVLKTGSNVSKWKNAFTRLVHPAGFIFFGEILIFIKLLTSRNTTAQPGWLIPAGLFNINLPPAQIGPVTFNDIGSYVEKTWTMLPTGSGADIGGKWDVGMWDHWENNKFNWWGGNGALGHYTIQDGINNNIGIQLGTAVVVTS
jgi:hypothetical protein|tara:strand:- start:568 stop:1914 length:1347 start_codon:yes stop_codon:yes gene_type:complete